LECTQGDTADRGMALHNPRTAPTFGELPSESMPFTSRTFCFSLTSVSIKKSQERSHGRNLAIFLRFRKNWRLQFIVVFIPDAPDRQDVFRRIRVRFYLFAQLPDERHNIAVIKQVVVLPYRLVDLLLGKHFAAVPGQKI